jgi:hypothetical protein
VKLNKILAWDPGDSIKKGGTIEMSSPIHRRVLTPKKTLWVFRLEQKIAEQNERIQLLEDALEDAMVENKQLHASVETGGLDVPCYTGQLNRNQPKDGSPLFQMSL